MTPVQAASAQPLACSTPLGGGPPARVTDPPLLSPPPRSPFSMDEFKRKYSNEDTLGVALPHFWENFDKEGWSVWYAEYRFPEELAQTFMSCNLITGEPALRPSAPRDSSRAGE